MHDYEFVWLLSGSAVWSWRGEGTVIHERLVPGILALCRPGGTDRFEWDADGTTVHGCVHFTVGDTAALGDPSTWPAVRTMEADDPMEELCRYLVARDAETGSDQHRLGEHTLALLLEIFVDAPSAGAIPAVPAPIAAAFELVGERWAMNGVRAVALHELANAASLSDAHLARLFRRRFGMGPARAVELLRLERAATELVRSNTTIRAAAERSGFADQFHFTRRFRQVYGSTPSEFRRAGRDALEPLAASGLDGIARDLRRRSTEGLTVRRADS